MVLQNDDKKWELFNYLSSRSSEVFISTYGFYAGITSSGHTVRSTKTIGARNLMSQLNTPTINSRILVGIPPFYSCKENCEECLSQRDGLRDRLQFHVNEFPNVDIAFTRKHHLKLFGFKSRTTGKYKVFTGGINFTCSDFNDVLVEVAKEEDTKILVNLFEGLWNTKPQPLGDISHWSLD